MGAAVVSQNTCYFTTKVSSRAENPAQFSFSKYPTEVLGEAGVHRTPSELYPAPTTGMFSKGAET